MKSRNASALHRAACTAIETLEGRRLLSTVTPTDNGDGTSTLTIIGTSGKDWVTIYDNPATNLVVVIDDKNRNDITDAGELTLLPNFNLTVLDVLTKGSDDRVKLQLFTDLVGMERSYNVDLGSGNDRFEFSAPTAVVAPPKGEERPVNDPNGADITESSDVVFDIDGSSGNDRIKLDFSRTTILCSSVIVGIDADTGNDKVDLITPVGGFEEGIIGCYEFDVAEELVQDGEAVFDDTPAVLQVQVDLDSGDDTVNLVNHSVLINGVFNFNVNGAGGKDVFNDTEAYGLYAPNFLVAAAEFISTNELGSRLTITANLGSQDDQYIGGHAFGEEFITTLNRQYEEVDFTTYAIQIDAASEARFNIQAGSEKDKIEIKDIDVDVIQPMRANRGIFDIGGYIDGLLEIQMYCGTGNDSAALDIDPGAVLNVGSTGVLRAILSGDSGSDKLALDARVSEISHGQYDIAMLGGSGNDSLGAAFQNDNLLANTPNHYGPRGYILLDGGLGTDKWDTEGNGIFKLRSVETLLESLQDEFDV